MVEDRRRWIRAVRLLTPLASVLVALSAATVAVGIPGGPAVASAISTLPVRVGLTPTVPKGARALGSLTSMAMKKGRAQGITAITR
jgi:hypothetical protein